MKVRLSYFVVVAYLLTLFGVQWAVNQPAVLSSESVTAPVQFNTTADAPDPNELFAIVNRQRTLAGVTSLEPDTQLAAIAEMRARDMVDRKYYAHQNPDQKHFGHLLADANIRAGYSCENLNLNFTVKPNQYVDEWMSSTRGHKSCMLHPEVTRAGYAVAVWDDVSVVGTPQKAYVVVAIHASN